MIRHDPDCTHCVGRGHIWVDPETQGWKAIEQLPGGRRRWAVKGGGLHVFDPRLPEQLMVLCICVVAS